MQFFTWRFQSKLVTIFQYLSFFGLLICPLYGPGNIWIACVLSSEYFSFILFPIFDFQHDCYFSTNVCCTEGSFRLCNLAICWYFTTAFGIFFLKSYMGVTFELNCSWMCIDKIIWAVTDLLHHIDIVNRSRF